MGISNKSNGRKSNKETQSPMLKIFKDIMQKDNIEAEKVTLLKDKKRDKKKKSYTESRSKSDPRSYDSSSTDRYNNHKQANITVQDILKDGEDYAFDRTRSDVRGGIKESFWFWQDKKKRDAKKGRNKANDDTCSCVSCALKKIISSECACVALLVLLFSVSVVIAFLFIFRGEPPCDMKQLIKRQLPVGYGTERNKWDRQLNSLDSVSDILDSANNYKTSYLNDMNVELSGDLASVLDNQQIDSHTSDKLRDFFEKLIQTDVKIKKLKNDINHYYQNDNLNTYTERFKRSLKSRFSNHHSRGLNEKKGRLNNFKRNSKKGKKRSPNRYNVTGYVIEEEKVLVEYEPGRKRNFPKCSHSHETKSHEKKLKHPFYKHSQRIDEMLNYKTPELVTFNLNQKEKFKQKPKTSKKPLGKMRFLDYKLYDDKQQVDTKNDEMLSNPRTNTTQEETSFDLEVFLSTTPLYDVALSVSTFINPWETNSPHISTNDRIGHRKLMEADEEDAEELNYDLKEVLSDDNQESDRIDKPLEIKKRDTDRQFNTNGYKYLPSQILNPNWKGPMPFYPDEINAMIRHAALQNYNNPKLSVTPKNLKAERYKIKKDVSDTEYIEDYADKKFNKIVKMAQAYSDYGVVYNKKDEGSKDKISKPEYRFKQSLPTYVTLDNKHKPTDGGEGIRIEYRKGNVKVNKEELVKDISKHIKIVKHPSNIEYDNSPFSKPSHLPVKDMDITKTTIPNKNEAFDIRKGSRSLKSIDITDESHENTNISTEFNQTSKHNASNIDSVFNFLAIMGDWFRSLSNLSSETNRLNGSSNSNNFTRLNSTKSKRVPEANSSGDTLYPSYDLDMIDNIGHRSRVLMSALENKTDEKSQTKHETRNDTESSKQPDSENIVPIALILAENIPNNSKENDTSNKKNMTSIVKRSIDDSKLVFWNDLYDDNEYGIKVDYEDKIREKHLANNKSVMQKSKDWIQGKFNNITGKVKNTLRTTMQKKAVTCLKQTKGNSKLEYIKPKKRKIRNSNENPDLTMKKTFATLNANMKKVCQQAAKAIQSTRNIEVREDNKDGAAATSLMQQLVRLMTDLVDIQVQQKTCAKLPADLQNFLEWLTAPVERNVRLDDLTPGIPDYAAVDDGFARFDKSTKSNIFTTLSISEDSHQDDRTECLGTIRAVQDLILQYEGMNDDDKSKMSGIKEYLKNQLNFLNEKINSPKVYEKRELPRSKRDSKEKPMKFIKNFSKKHTKTTFSDYGTTNHEDIILNKYHASEKVMSVKLTKDEFKRS